MSKLTSKKLLVFDLDGTLTKSKFNLDHQMASLLCRLLEKRTVAVVGGGNYKQFKSQFLDFLKCPNEKLQKLVVLPTSGAALYRYKRGWRPLYKHSLSPKEKNKILAAFEKALRDIKYVRPTKIYGTMIDDRQSQMTFSALGQKAPLAKKEWWHKKQDVRQVLRVALKKYLPQFEIRLGGLTSIDITKKGIDKAYGVAQIMKISRRRKADLLYIGDALFKGGNDYVVKKTGIATLAVKGPKETKKIIRLFLKNKI